MSSDKYAIEQTIRLFFVLMGLPNAQIIIERFEELENFDFVEFSYKRYALKAMVFLQGEYHNQPGYLFLDSASVLMFVTDMVEKVMEEHKKDYPHGVGL